MQAQWKFKNLFKGDAQKVADEIGNRKVTPQEVLEIARNENTELHKCFEWDNDVAAEKYRLIQAQRIIINLVFSKTDNEQEDIRCFQITTEKNTYQPAQQFLVQQDEYQALLKRAKAELEAFRRRYASLTELEEVLKAIEAL